MQHGVVAQQPLDAPLLLRERAAAVVEEGGGRPGLAPPPLLVAAVPQVGLCATHLGLR